MRRRFASRVRRLLIARESLGHAILGFGTVDTCFHGNCIRNVVLIGSGQLLMPQGIGKDESDFGT